MAAPGPGAGAIRGGFDGGPKVALGRLDATRPPSSVSPLDRPARGRDRRLSGVARVPASRNRFPAEGAVAAPLPAWACACGLRWRDRRCGNGTVRQETRETAVRSPRPPRLLVPPPTLPVGLEQLQEARTSSGLPAASRPGEVRPEARLSCNRGTERQHALRNRPERSQAGPANLRRQRLAGWPFGRPWGRPERSGTAFRPRGGHGRYRRRSLQPRRNPFRGAELFGSPGRCPNAGEPWGRPGDRLSRGPAERSAAALANAPETGPPAACVTVRDVRHRRDPLVPAERLGKGRLTLRARWYGGTGTLRRAGERGTRSA